MEQEIEIELDFMEIGRQQNGELVALLMNVKNPELSSLKKAWAANAPPTSRSLLPYTEKMLKNRISQLKNMDQEPNIKALNKALEKLVEKKEELTQDCTASEETRPVPSGWVDTPKPAM